MDDTQMPAADDDMTTPGAEETMPETATPAPAADDAAGDDTEEGAM